MHWFSDGWQIDDNIYTLDEKLLFNYVKINKTIATVINFDDIAYRTDIDRGSYRYFKANVSYPLMVTQMSNPYNKPYRLIDGKHRIHKLMDQGLTQSACYMIPSEFVLKNLKRIR